MWSWTLQKKIADALLGIESLRGLFPFVFKKGGIMLIDGKHVKFKITSKNKLLLAYQPGDACEFRQDDGKYHGGYKILRKEKEGDDLIFVFSDPDGNEFKHTWWNILKYRNEDTFRLTWPDDESMRPPDDYEWPVNS